MNILQKLKTAKPLRSEGATLALLVGSTAVLLMSIGALNGGQNLAASVWDGLKTYLEGLLSSSFVIVLALIALVALVWQIAHGRGYQHVGAVLGVLAVAVLGPGLATAAATATREPAPIVAHAHTAAPMHAVTTVALQR
jgi:hypothetical protein